MYMLYKIKNEVCSRINVVLEGGYNLEEIPIATEGLVSILNGYSFPNKFNDIRISLESYKTHLKPISLFLNNLNENFKFWTKFWPVLDSDYILEY